MSTKSRTHTLEPGSLRHRILARPSSYVPPIQWEPELLNDIDCDLLPTSTDDDCNNSTIPVIEDARVADALDALSSARVRKNKDEAARGLFRLLIPTDHSAFKASSFSPHLLFDGKPVAPTPSPLLFRSTATSRPIFAFVDKTWLSDQRYKVFRRHTVKTAYKIVQSMIKLDFDPYIAGLLLSMAQNSCSFTADDEIQVHVFSPSTDHKSLTQYSSNVSRQYLRKWEKSYESSSCRLTITRKKLPFDQPNAIIQAMCKIEKPHAYSLGTLVSPQKRKAMSDITNRLDKLPAVKRVRH